MNGKQHTVIGLIGVPMVDLIIQLNEKRKGLRLEVNVARLVAAGAVGAITARLPDLIEPAIHPNHRAFFHSIVFGCVLSLAFTGVVPAALATPKVHAFLAELEIPAEEVALVLRWAAISYLLHLGADFTTPKSIPFIHPQIG